MRKVLGAMALLALSACGSGGEEAPTRNVTSIKTDGAYIQRLRGLSKMNRDLALRRAVQDSGLSCKRVLSTEETGTYKNMVTWTARCEGNRNWAIFIAPNGNTQVRDCRDVEELGLPACKTGTGTSKQAS